MYDPVLERIWRVRRKIARECDYDTKKYARYIKEQHDLHVEERRKAGKPVSVITHTKTDLAKLRRALKRELAKPGVD